VAYTAQRACGWPFCPNKYLHKRAWATENPGGGSPAVMQQFARRPEPEGQEPTGPIHLAPDSVAQLLDQITELTRQVSAVKDELATIKSENNKLRVQIAGGIAQQEAADTRPIAPEVKADEPVVSRAPVTPEDVVTPKTDSTKKTDAEKSAQDKIDEEFLVDLVRAQGVKESTTPTKTEVIDTVLAIEQRASGPMSDDDIQRMLAEAALGAFDAASPSVTKVANEETAAQPVHGEEPDNRPFLHLEDEAPIEEPALVIEAFTLDLTVTAKVPSHLAIAALAVPHRLEGTKLYCKSAQPFDIPALDMLADATAYEVVAEPAHMEDVLAALRKAYGDENASMEKDYAWSVSESQPKRKRGLFRRAA
jgi:hypothetical protein